MTRELRGNTPELMEPFSSPLILKAKPVADALALKTAKAVESFRSVTGRAPTLTTILVGEDPASQVYVKKKGETCLKLGMGHKDFKLSASTSQNELAQLVTSLNMNDEVDGILVQKPLPRPLYETEIFDLIRPDKDVDCFSPHNVGLLVQGRATLKPCTPAGVMEILNHYKIPTAGKCALILGRSDIVGKPMGQLLLQGDATVTYAHSRTQNIPELISNADIIVAAIGRPLQFGSQYKWKKSAVVIDVGINRLPDGSLAGDVDYNSVHSQVHAITPVPGGVGPMTIAMLMVNTVTAAYQRARMSITF